MITALTFGQIEALTGSTLPYVIFVKLDWTLDPLQEETLGHTRYLCSALRDFTWNTYTWRGMGAIAAMEPIVETTTNEVTGTRISIPSASLSTRAQILQQKIQGTPCYVWIGLLDANEQLIGDPILEYKGTLDVPELADNATPDGKAVSTSISITVEGLMVDYRRTGRYRRYTDRDQQQLYPGDTYCRFVGKLKERALGWGIPGGPR